MRFSVAVAVVHPARVAVGEHPKKLKNAEAPTLSPRQGKCGSALPQHQQIISVNDVRIEVWRIALLYDLDTQ